MGNMKTVTEFVYLQLKPDVKPEDPENEGGKQFSKIISSIKQSRGFQGGSWGRTVENQNDVVLAVGEFYISLFSALNGLLACHGDILYLVYYPH